MGIPWDAFPFQATHSYVCDQKRLLKGKSFTLGHDILLLHLDVTLLLHEGNQTLPLLPFQALWQEYRDCLFQTPLWLAVSWVARPASCLNTLWAVLVPVEWGIKSCIGDMRSSNFSPEGESSSELRDRIESEYSSKRIEASAPRELAVQQLWNCLEWRMFLCLLESASLEPHWGKPGKCDRIP